jgi:hypothetical protein
MTSPLAPVALRAEDVRAAMVAYRDVLRAHREALNRLNVYPVPDGDTGTNMALTVEAVVRELDDHGTSSAMAAVCRAVSHGSLMGARGNSGVILSQLLRGLCEQLAAAEEAGPEVLAAAFVVASELATKAVVRPVEGTILTVARAAGEGATAALEKDEALLGVIEHAKRAASDALAKTPTMLEALARAGVVDAGGAGYVLFFDALLSALDGRALPPPPAGGRAEDRSEPATDLAPLNAPTGGSNAAEAGAGGSAPDDLRYEVMYLLDAPDDSIGAFKDVWAGIGDSIVVVGGDGTWQCHIHTNDIGPTIEAAIDIGRPYRIRVTDLHEQVQEERWVRDAARFAEVGTGGTPGAVTGVVAVVAGEGIGRIFRSLGAQRLVPGGQSMNPSTAQLLDAVRSLPCTQVVVLPNNENVEPVAQQVDALTEKTVRVVPTGSIVEGFAALLAYDPAAGVEENAVEMAASARRVVPGAVTRAVRDAATAVGEVHAGDWLGISRKDVVAVAGSPDDAVLQLLERLVLPSHELVTVIEGEGSTPAATRRITEWLHEERPEIETEVHHGGQPLYPYLLGIE